jgi:hypothetical protein
VFAVDWISDGTCCAALLKAEVSCCVADVSVCWPELRELVTEVKFGVNIAVKVLVKGFMF